MLLNQNRIRRVGALGLLSIAAGAAYAGALAPQQKASADARMTAAQGSHLLANRSAQFVENKGQWNPQARFLAKGSNLDLWFTDHGIRYDQHAASKKGGKRQVVDMAFVGGTTVRTAGRGVTGSRSDYYTSAKPVLGVHSYHELLSRNVYPGVDVRSYFDKGKPRYDVIVAPNADPSRVKLAYRGASGLKVKNGELRIGTVLGGIVNGKPFAYQNVGGKRMPVYAAWSVDGKNVARFALGNYDHSKPLVIDPVVYGSYIGGDGGADEVRSVVADANQSVLLTGSTTTSNFPINTGILVDGTYNNYVSAVGNDAFIFQLSGDAYDRDYAVFIGGAGTDTGQYLKIDAQNNIWLAGTTTSATFFGTTTNAVANVFVMRLTRTSAAAVPTLSTSDILRFGPTTGAQAFLTGFDVLSSTPSSATSTTTFALSGLTLNASALTTAGFAVPTGETTPTVRTGFIAKYQYDPTVSTGSRFTPNVAGNHFMVGSTGSPNDTTGLVFDTAGNEIVAGTVFGIGFGGNVDTSTTTGAAVFTTTSGVFANGVVGYNGRLLRNADAYVRKYTAAGNLLYSGLLGGSGEDTAGGFALGNTAGLGIGTDTGLVFTGPSVGVDSSGNVYMAGVSRSYFFPATTGAYFENFTSTNNVFVTKISADFGTILYSTGLGVSQGETNGVLYSFQQGQNVRVVSVSSFTPAGLVVDSLGRAFVSMNLRPNGYTFPPPTGGDPNEIVSSTLPNLNIPGNLTDVPDNTYSSPTGTDFPTTEGALTVVDPTGQNLIYDTYIGGLLDDMVYAPYVDTFGDVWVMGYSDASRLYQFQSSTGTIVQHVDNANLGGLISANAFKGAPDNFRAVTLTSGYGFFATSAGTVNSPPTYQQAIARDGFVTKFRVGLPSVAAVSLNPATLPGGLGRFSTGTITLNTPAPLGGATVTVSIRDAVNQNLVTSTNATLAATPTAGAENTSVPTLDITIPQGQTVGTFYVYSKPVALNTTVFVRATYLGSYKQASLSIVPFLSSVTLSSGSVIGGNNVQGTVNLSGPVPQDTSIPIVVDVPSLGFLTGTVTVLANQSSATFTLGTHGVDATTPIRVTASLGLNTASTTIQLTPATIQSVTLAPTTVGGGTTSSVTVTLDGEAGPSGVGFTLSATNGVTLSAASGSIAQNLRTSAAITATAPVVASATSSQISASVATASITAERPAKTVSSTLTIVPASLAGITLTPASVPSGGVSTGTVTLSTAAPANGVYVYLSLSSTRAYFSPSANGTLVNNQLLRLFIAGGATTGSFTVNAAFVGTDTQVTVTAGATQAAATSGGTGTVSATLTIKATTFHILLNPTSVVGGEGSVTGTVTLDIAPTSGTVYIAVSSSNPTAASIDGANSAGVYLVPIAAGQTTGTFTITTHGVSAVTAVTISATAGGTPQTATLTVNPVGLLSVTASPSSVLGGSTTPVVLSIRFNGTTVATTGNDTLTVTFSNNAAIDSTAPRSFTIPAGYSATNPFRLGYRTNRLSLTQKITVTVNYHGSSASTTFTIVR